MPVRSMRAFCTRASSSAGSTVKRPALRRPMGVRTASTITTFERLDAVMSGTVGPRTPLWLGRVVDQALDRPGQPDRGRREAGDEPAQPVDEHGERFALG